MGETIEAGLEIAVIGMAARFPDAKNIDEFWENLKNGVESISFFSDRELEEAGVDSRLIMSPVYVKAKGVIEEKEYFDAGFFGYTPTEAEVLDPQVRMFHECVWTALEDSGYDPEVYDGLIGLYAGAVPSPGWEIRSFFSGKANEIGNFTARHLVLKDYLSLRISYKLNLVGPSFSLYTSCSTSLVAIHLACQGILNGESDMALAGGVTISLLDETGYMYREGMIFSPDGHCRTFDARAKGTIAADGAGVVVLKRLEDAISARDYIHAVIKGSNINNDGLRKAGFTAPSVEGQAEVIKMAHQMAEVEPESITYIEAHGTGTELGDPVEIEALKLAFNTDKKCFCAIGSVKTNFGHLDVAAGVAGFIKTVLALKHKLIPPNLHFQAPNPEIDFENSPFYVNAALKKWRNNGSPLRAGVSSLGIGGTNAHVILEEASYINKGEESPPLRDYHLILLSAKTRSALEKITGNLSEYFKKNPGINLANAAYTLQVGRRAFQCRRMLGCSTVKEAIGLLSSPGAENLYESVVEVGNKNVIFMFPGQGAQYVNMGWGLYHKEPMFREEMDRCFDILKSIMGYGLKEVLYIDQSVNKVSGASSEKINQTEIAQPLLFIIEYSLAALLMKWGLKPYAMIGHSIGEYVAACLSGVFTLEDALKVVVLRGRLMQKMPAGAMLSVLIPEEDLKPLLNPGLSLAAVNGPAHCVVSGANETIDHFENQLEDKGYRCRRLHTSHAFHSKMVEPIVEHFEENVERIRLNNPKIPYISNITGNWITAEEAAAPGHWAKHLRKTVRFSNGLRTLLKEKNVIFVEVGPGKTLGTFVRQHEDKKNKPLVITPVRHPGEDTPDENYFLNQVGRLWLYGLKIDWNKFYSKEKMSRIPLPTYPFEGRPYWIQADFSRLGADVLSRASLLNKKKNITDFFYVPIWTQSILAADGAREVPLKNTCLVFTDKCGIGDGLIKRMKKEKYEAVIVEKSKGFSKISDRKFGINPGQVNDYHALMHELFSSGGIPRVIVHLWSIGGDNQERLDIKAFKTVQNSGFYSLVYLARAIREQNLTENIHITVVSTGMHEVTGEETLSPEKSTVLAPVNVIPQEFPNISCRGIDIVLPGYGTWQENKMIEQLLTEISTRSPDKIAAYRNNRRWVQNFVPVRLEENKESQLTLKEAVCCLVTGGLGNIGLVLAENLAGLFKARLILTARSALPGRKDWENWLDTHHDQDHISHKIKKIQKIEAMGGEVMVFTADVADYHRMKEVIESAEKRFGKINGIIHAAGVTRGKSNPCAIENISEKDGEEQFYPKVYGLLVLEKLFRNRAVDFCLLTSSLSSILGGLGFTTYSAANIFMDAFVKKYGQTHPCNWISVNWDGWLPEENRARRPGGENPEELVLTAEEGKKAFQRILAWSEENQVVVSTGDLQSRIDRWIKLESLPRENNSRGEEISALRERPGMTTPYAAPRCQVEQSLAHIWQNFFGIEKIGIRDDFFELGGDSLKTMTAAAKIHRELGVSVPLTVFFNSPTIEKIAEYIHNTEKKTYFSIEPAEEKEFYSLSSAQKRIYILQQIELTSTSYNTTIPVLLAGELKKEELQDIFKELIERHESLRTSFTIVNEEPVQEIHDKAEFTIEYYDISRPKPAAGTWQRAGAIIQRFVRPFDLSRAPAIRVGLIKNEDREHILIMDVHHIISDGLSMAIFVKEFMALYEKKKLPQMKLQYKDFSVWQNKLLKSGEIEKQGAYWLKKFETGIPVLHLPGDYQRPAVKSSQGNKIDFEIEKSVTGALKEMAHTNGATLFMVLLAVYNVLLSKLSSQEHIVVGTPTAGRQHTDLENIIGIFINTLALLNCPSARKTFDQFLNEVKESTVEAFENQDYQLEDLVEKIKVQRDTSRSPLFDTLFSLQSLENKEPEEIREKEDSGLKIVPHKYEYKSSKFDLSLDIIEKSDGLFFSFEYCTRLFKKETIERFINYFKEIVAIVLENKNIKLQEINLSHDMMDVETVDLKDLERGFQI